MKLHFLRVDMNKNYPHSFFIENRSIPSLDPPLAPAPHHRDVRAGHRGAVLGSGCCCSNKMAVRGAGVAAERRAS